jgi:hypothetical protein
MSAVIGEDAEESVEELKHDHVTAFENHTPQARELSRTEVNTTKESDAEDLQHKSPGLKKRSALQERNPNAPDPREDMTESMREATPSQDDLAEPEQQATPTRLQAAWVIEAVAAFRSNKKVRFLILPGQDKH